MTYAWTFGDGGTSTQVNPTHTYSSAGRYVARLTVSDGTNSSLSRDIVINVGSPPTATILTPSSGTLFRAGDAITYSGSGTDPEDGTLSASAFSWTILFHHESHVHPAGGPFVGTTTGTLQIPTSGHDFQGATSYEIVLTVTDSTGLTNTTSVTVFPDKVNLSFDTVPSGLTVEIDGISRQTPFVLDDLKGFSHTINAPAQSRSGTSYTFVSWSDGGAQSHGITVPTTNQSYVATFQAGSATPPGLVAGYAMDEGAGTNVADASGSGNAGSMTGAVWSQGKYGQALSFDSIGDAVTVADSASLDLTSGMTIEAWVNPTILGGYRTILMKQSSGYFAYSLYATPGGLAYGELMVGGSSVGTSGGSVLPLNAWSHVAATYDGSTLRLFVNGGQVSSVARTGAIDVTTGPLRIGSNTLWTDEFWSGRIDDVRVYNRALTTAEIQTDMVTPLGGQPPSDTQPPSVPGGVGASVVSASQINVSWSASSDNVGVTGYRVERCQGVGCSSFVQVAAPAGTSFGDTGLAASTSYSYRVRAADAAGNLSGYSSVVSATTQPPSDTQPPSVPGGVGASVVSASQINVSWSASSDNVGVTGYRVERCQGVGCSSFVQVAAPAGTSFGDTGLAASTSYSYRVRAADAAGNLSGYSSVVSATTQPPSDTQPPSVPGGVGASVVSASQINVSWSASSDNVGVTGYRVERCQGVGCSSFVQVAAPAGTSFGDTGLAASTSYSYRVRAADAAGNLSGYSSVVSATTQPPSDMQPPSVPGGVGASVVSRVRSMCRGRRRRTMWV